MAKGGLIEFLVSGFPQAANGYIKAYSTKTTVLKSLYLDRGLTQLAPVNTQPDTVFDNTISLSIYGSGQFYGTGLYTIVLMSSNGSVISTFDDVHVKDPGTPYYEISDYASLAAAVTAIGSTKATLLIDRDLSVDDLTIPANLELTPINGAIITVNAGKTLTINGPFSAGLYQCFAGSGTVTGLKEAYPDWFTTNTTPGTTDMTYAMQCAVNAAPKIRGNGKPYLISSVVNVTGETFDLRDMDIDLGTSYTTQGYLYITSKFIAVDNVTVEGHRSGSKVGLEGWTVFTTFGGFSSIRPTLYSIFYTVNWDVGTTISMTRMKFNNIHAYRAIYTQTYGNVVYDDIKFNNISYSAITGTHTSDVITHNGGTNASNIYVKDVGLLLDTFSVDGVEKAFATTTFLPQGAYGLSVTGGYYNLTNATVENYGSAAVVADRNLEFNSSNIVIKNNSVRSWSNNPSGGMWLEEPRLANLTNTTIDIQERHPSEDGENSAIVAYGNGTSYGYSKINIDGLNIRTHQTVAKLYEGIRAPYKGKCELNVSNFSIDGVFRGFGINHIASPSNAILGTIKLTNGTVDGDILIDGPYAASLDHTDVTGDVTIRNATSGGTTGSSYSALIRNSAITGTVSNTATLTVPFSYDRSGTYTPVITGSATVGAGTYTTQIGRYAVLGNRCTVWVSLVWTAHDGTGNLKVSLPIAASSTSTYSSGTAMNSNLTFTAGANIHSYTAATLNYMYIGQSTTGAAFSNLQMDSAGELYITLTYEI